MDRMWRMVCVCVCAYARVVRVACDCAYALSYLLKMSLFFLFFRLSAVSSLVSTDPIPVMTWLITCWEISQGKIKCRLARELTQQSTWSSNIFKDSIPNDKKFQACIFSKPVLMSAQEEILDVDRVLKSLSTVETRKYEQRSSLLNQDYSSHTKGHATRNFEHSHLKHCTPQDSPATIVPLTLHRQSDYPFVPHPSLKSTSPRNHTHHVQHLTTLVMKTCFGVLVSFLLNLVYFLNCLNGIWTRSLRFTLLPPPPFFSLLTVIFNTDFRCVKILVTSGRRSFRWVQISLSADTDMTGWSEGVLLFCEVVGHQINWKLTTLNFLKITVCEVCCLPGWSCPLRRCPCTFSQWCIAVSVWAYSNPENFHSV